MNTNTHSFACSYHVMTYLLLSRSKQTQPVVTNTTPPPPPPKEPPHFAGKAYLHVHAHVYVHSRLHQQYVLHIIHACVVYTYMYILYVHNLSMTHS